MVYSHPQISYSIHSMPSSVCSNYVVVMADIWRLISHGIQT